jgi:hypothetical protein
MGAHNLLFWMSLAAGVAVLCLIALFKMARPPRNEVTSSPDVQDLSNDV